MSSKRLWMPLLAGTLGLVAVAGAQPPEPPPAPVPPPDTVFFLSNAAPVQVQAFGGRIDFLRAEGDIPGAVVKDKPYSARAITQSTQTLADGNRITHRNETRIYRDSQGRTRREQTIGGVGPWQTSGEPVTMITINDPVTGKSHVLDPGARTAREMRPFQFQLAHAEAGVPGAARVNVDVDKMIVTRGTAPAPVPVPVPGENMTVIRTQTDGGNEDVRVFTRGVAIGVAPFAGSSGAFGPAEDLGEQVLEGLLVKGERLTDTIPAGAMGNERPIEIVTERWYSKDIEALVRHRFFDPRSGETTYELVNVARGDPSPDLFEVPQGYEVTVAEGPVPVVAPLPPVAPGGIPGSRVRIETRVAE